MRFTPSRQAVRLGICARVQFWGSPGWHLAAENLCGVYIYVWGPSQRSPVPALIREVSFTTCTVLYGSVGGDFKFVIPDPQSLP